MRNKKNNSSTPHKFIDLFAGCGGLSLGLAMAGLRGQFAIEKDSMAFSTLADNFLGEREVPVDKFEWPSWLEQRAWSIDDLLAQHQTQLEGLQGKISVLAGGPPCQGFSFAGRRQEADPRNMLFERYVRVVELIKPSIIVLENVPGMKVAHNSLRDGNECAKLSTESYYDKLKRGLEAIGYGVEGRLLNASRYGVPQKRSRLIVLGIRSDLIDRLEGGVDRIFLLLESKRVEQLRDLGLPESIPVGEAISDLRSDLPPLKACIDPDSPNGFHEAESRGPAISQYQHLMQKHCSPNAMNSMRLARHGAEIRKRFSAILQDCARGVSMHKLDRERYGLKKHRIHPMSMQEPAPTITTLPEDVLHYAEPRILTVRESARIQSFPDWFNFRGKFTTGGNRRTKECPRYTQVGNAVPPLLGRAIGLAILEALNESGCSEVAKKTDQGVVSERNNQATTALS